MLSITENIGVAFGVECGVSSGVAATIDAVGLGVGETLPFKSPRSPRVAIHAILRAWRSTQSKLRTHQARKQLRVSTATDYAADAHQPARTQSDDRESETVQAGR
jgi:hypothetical protein